MALLRKPLAKPGITKPAGSGLKPKPSLMSKTNKARDPDEGGVKRAAIKKGGAFDKMNQEREAIATRTKEPWRLSVPVGGRVVGYFLDKGEPWSRYEHKIGGGPGKRPKIFACIKDTGEACPICDAEGKEGNHTLFLTVIIPTLKYKRKNEKGREEEVVQKYAKRLVPIGMKVAGKYQRLYEKHGTFRGMKVTIIRDGKMDPGSGNDIEFEEMLPEATLKTLARKGVAAIEEYAKEARKDIKDLDTDFLNPFDYDDLMAAPDAKELAKMAKVGMRKGIGSADFSDDDDDFGDTGGFDDDED